MAGGSLYTVVRRGGPLEALNPDRTDPIGISFNLRVEHLPLLSLHATYFARYDLELSVQLL